MDGISYGQGRERLEHLLGSVDRPGDYCVGGRLYTAMPRVFVDGVGELSFPVRKAQVEALTGAAERAPLGKGTETVLDPSVRDCWQIDAGSVRVVGRAWPNSFAKMLDLVATGLGLPRERLGAELYKLLVYRPGGFFAAHRDTEKVAGMVATLSVSLPTPGTGGELVVRHGERETTFDVSAEEPSELAFAAFYADCLHEARPVTSGHRLSLVFNLFLRSGDSRFMAAPDYAVLAAPVAECLAEWRGEGTTEKLVWLLEHEYSEDGLSFDTLKNTDAAVADVLAEAADRADCALHAAVFRIEERGMPRIEPVYGRWGWDRDFQESTTMEEVHDRWAILDGWAAPDGSRPPFGGVTLNDGELLPQGALDDAEPDDHRLEGSTGNTGPTLELFYRYAALVVWPRDKTVDIVACGSIDRAVSWVAGECARARDSGDATARRLLAGLTELWPVGEDSYRRQDRAAMLRLLRTEGQGDLAADFLHRVVTANYDGSENEALAGVMPLLGAEEARGFLAGFVAEHLPIRPRAIITFLALAGGRREFATNPDWREVLSQAVDQTLSSLGAALRAQSEAPASVKDDRRSELRTPYREPDARTSADGWMDHEAVRDLFVLAWRLGLASRAVPVARSMGEHPEIVTPDRMLPAALADMWRYKGMRGTTAYGVLWGQAADFLLARSSAPPFAPNDWTIGADIPCTCEHCAKLRRFCRDPVARVERFKVRKDLRKHLHRTIDRHRLDLRHQTQRKGSPYTLVCAKNRASHKRRLEEYGEDLLRIDSLLVSMPEGERREAGTGRAGRLEEALASGGG